MVFGDLVYRKNVYDYDKVYLLNDLGVYVLQPYETRTLYCLDSKNPVKHYFSTEGKDFGYEKLEDLLNKEGLELSNLESMTMDETDFKLKTFKGALSLVEVLNNSLKE